MNSFGILHTDVSEQTTGQIFDCMTLEDGTDRLSRSVCKEQRKVPKQHTSHLHRGQSLKSSNFSYLSRYIQNFSLYFKISEFVRINYTISCGTLVGKDFI